MPTVIGTLSEVLEFTSELSSKFKVGKDLYFSSLFKPLQSARCPGVHKSDKAYHYVYYFTGQNDNHFLTYVFDWLT